jgi:sugar lactone lactonase YvrE
VSSLAWSLDGTTLYTTDGRVIDAWPIDLATGASPAEVRARLERLTTAQIRGDHAETP